ncbi:hypothetical protein V7S43_001983 [Phytophthora oleae]|uniref:Uncharacterized protein n=1 Tax=Phytophthora oleae TaxID=2107226 RepID=A0ABD3G2J2_9STRA
MGVLLFIMLVPVDVLVWLNFYLRRVQRLTWWTMRISPYFGLPLSMVSSFPTGSRSFYRLERQRRFDVRLRNIMNALSNSFWREEHRSTKRGLHIASSNDFLLVVELLFDYGAVIDLVDADATARSTALQEVAMQMW